MPFTVPPRSVLPAAVLWDMDGTLVDTEPYWFSAEGDLVRAHGGDWSREQAESLVGSNLATTARVMREHGVPLTDEAIVERLIDQVLARAADEVPWRPGALDLLSRLREAGVPLALVTASYARLVEVVLAALPPRTFRAVVTGDEVAHGKPHPEPYLTAAERLGVRIEDCVAIEDSDNGARSAEAAGARVLVVENHVQVSRGPARTHLAGLDAVWSALTGT